MKQLGRVLLEYWVMPLAEIESISDIISLLPDFQLMNVKIAQARNSSNRVVIDTGASPSSDLHSFTLMLLLFWKPNKIVMLTRSHCRQVALLSLINTG